MEELFSLRRITLLLKRYFWENWNYEMQFLAISIFMFTVLDNRYFVLIVIFLSGFIYSVHLHKYLFQKPNNLQFMLIPATITEKLISTVLLNTLYHFGKMVLAYYIGNWLITLVYHFILRIPIPVNWDLFQVSSLIEANGNFQVKFNDVFWPVFSFFALTQSIFLFGSLYFNKHFVPKTVFFMLVFGFSLFLIQILIFKTLWGVKHISNAIIPMLVMIFDSKIPSIIRSSILYSCYLLIPYSWILSYFSLKEKEI